MMRWRSFPGVNFQFWLWAAILVKTGTITVQSGEHGLDGKEP